MSSKPLDSFFRLPGNIKLFVIALIACNLAVSNYHCHKENDTVSCPVEYEVENMKNLTLKGKWKFIGFENPDTKLIEYPPCGDTEAFIVLTDSLHDRPEKEIFYYPFLFHGRALINSYIGSFVTEPGNKIKFSETIRSHVNGTQPIERFQNHFHSALKTAERYEISNNLLMIYYNEGKRSLLFVSKNDTIKF